MLIVPDEVLHLLESDGSWVFANQICCAASLQICSSSQLRLASKSVSLMLSTYSPLVACVSISFLLRCLIVHSTYLLSTIGLDVSTLNTWTSCFLLDNNGGWRPCLERDRIVSFVRGWLHGHHQVLYRAGRRAKCND